jgi:serine phosphatase RsbU (regulator of sigma subunit)
MTTTARLHIEPAAGTPFDRDLTGQQFIVGRATDSDLVVQDSSVSRHHARLFQRDGQWWAEDLGARNGTTLNDAPLKSPTALGAGDRLRLGDTVLRFVPPAEAATTRTMIDDDENIDRQAARLRTLNEIHRALATPISQSELLELILERCFEVLRPEEGVIVLRDRRGGFTTAATRRKPGSTGNVLVSRSLMEEVIERGRPALVIDAAFDERFSGSESIIASGVRSVVAAPLSDAEGSIGMIALLSRVNVRKFSEQDLDMLGSLASAAALRVRNIALAEEAAARKVLERELALAHDMQMAMLPRRMPERPEIDLAASVTPARSVGGDLYDFVATADGLWFTVADVSGKGVPAALYTAVAKTLFRATVQACANVGEALTRMNAELARDNDQLMFITAIVGYISFASGEVMLGDAGHNPALLLRRGGALETPTVPKCMAFGVLEDTPYEHGVVQLHPGDTLVLYTDGATDARAPNGELFGSDRLEEAVSGCSGLSAAEMLHSISSVTMRFAEGAPPEDDVTLMVLRYQGSAQ